MMWIFAFLTKMWAYLIDTGAPLETGELILIGEDFDISHDLAETDLVRPTFTGYADAAVAGFTASVTGEGIPYITAAPIVFIPTNGTNLPQFVYGAAILDVDGDLVKVTKFSTPLQLAHALQQLHCTPKLYFDPDDGVELEVSLG